MASGPDTTYFARRGRQSLAARDAATDRGARLAHAQLAAAYDNLAGPTPDEVGRENGIGAPPVAAAPSRDALMTWADEGGEK